MNLGEGIYCNCEIAAWFRVMDGEMSEPRYRVSNAINDKVEQITKLIKQERWKRPEI